MAYRIQDGQSMFEFGILLHHLLQLRGIILREDILLKPTNFHGDLYNLILLQFGVLIGGFISSRDGDTHQLLDSVGF